MSSVEPLECYLDVNAKCADVYDVILKEVDASTISIVERNPADFYLLIKIKGGMTRDFRGDQVDIKVEQYDSQVSRIYMSIRGMRSLDVVRRKDLNNLMDWFQKACQAIETTVDEVTQLDDVASLMSLAESSNPTTSEAAVIKLVELAQAHQASGNQVDALLILAPLASKYCIPAIDALIRIAAEKGDMAGLESWSAKKAEAEGIVKSGHGSPVAGVQKSYLPQLAALGLVATNLNLMRINNEIGDMGDTVAEGFDSISDLF